MKPKNLVILFSLFLNVVLLAFVLKPTAIDQPEEFRERQMKALTQGDDGFYYSHWENEMLPVGERQNIESDLDLGQLSLGFGQIKQQVSRKLGGRVFPHFCGLDEITVFEDLWEDETSGKLADVWLGYVETGNVANSSIRYEWIAIVESPKATDDINDIKVYAVNLKQR